MPKLGNETPVYTREQGFDMQIAYDASKRTEYVGISAPGTATSVLKWSIYRLKYDTTSGGVSIRRYADSSDGFEFSWDLKHTYTYLGI